MATKLKQIQSQKQKLAPRQVLNARLLQLNVVNLEQTILKELEQNPTLEQLDPVEDQNVDIEKDNPIEDNTSKVVNELVDLWLELRAIRNAVEYNDDDYSYLSEKEPTAFEKYHSKVEEIEEEWNDNQNYMNKIFKDNIDPSVLAYLHLDEDDKLLLTN